MATSWAELFPWQSQRKSYAFLCILRDSKAFRLFTHRFSQYPFDRDSLSRSSFVIVKGTKTITTGVQEYWSSYSRYSAYWRKFLSLNSLGKQRLGVFNLYQSRALSSPAVRVRGLTRNSLLASLLIIYRRCFIPRFPGPSSVDSVLLRFRVASKYTRRPTFAGFAFCFSAVFFFLFFSSPDADWIAIGFGLSWFVFPSNKWLGEAVRKWNNELEQNDSNLHGNSWNG